MSKIKKADLTETALKLLPAVYESAMRRVEEDSLFQHENWRTGVCLDAFLLAEAFEDAVTYRDAESEPKLKQLDQIAFNHPYVDDRFNYVALNADGQSIFFEQKPSVSVNLDIWVATGGSILPMLKGYDATNWQDSLIERENKELTGSDLCRYIKSRKHWVLAVVSDENDATAEFHQTAAVVTDIASDGRFKCGDMTWRYAVPIDHKGEPLTQAQVGL